MVLVISSENDAVLGRGTGNEKVEKISLWRCDACKYPCTAIVSSFGTPGTLPTVKNCLTSNQIIPAWKLIGTDILIQQNL